ncbi:hypothetical protein JSY14_05025 [Brachybacterium sp. EF45031]|uniref:hypothetical protein n=1 Tax=Brachybacterium sillae TaxID=2810536 RepID=UPI00217EA73E|nr:hypothetical protein [Brachybacterium sillae]MCS6711414.1 hypothetical protein [Brachybacterium sillae]
MTYSTPAPGAPTPGTPTPGAPSTAPGAVGIDRDKLRNQGILWTILGALLGGLLSIPALILGILGIAKVDTDPAGAQKLIKWTKLVTIIGLVLSLLFVVGYIILMVVLVGSAGTTY